MTTFATSRTIPATPQEIYAAFAAPERLARWWGPAGFTNTFHTCDFVPGGRWSFVMHGPDGGHYPNESHFAGLVADEKVVIQHDSPPRFCLTITLTPVTGGTLVTWEQAIEDAALAEKVRAIVVPANEQNLDRLTGEVTGAATPAT
jgi:uncharacterized protein YndB with AHSA1/START domain